MILFCSSGLRRAHTVDDWLVGIACEGMLHVCHGTAVDLTAESQVHAFSLCRNLALKQDWLPELDCSQFGSRVACFVQVVNLLNVFRR